MSKLFYFIFFLFILFINCNNCFDESCSECTSDGIYCYQCKKGFIQHYSKCGKKCKSITNCNLCNADETKCIKCKSNCIFNGKYCDCTERYALLFVFLFLTIFIIGVIIFCLIHPLSRRTTFFLNAFSLSSGSPSPSLFNRSNISRNPLHEEINNNKIKELELIKDFNKNKINVDEDIETKKCFVCKNNNCNLKMGCGCFLCFECEKKCIKANICLNCNNSITTMQQISCSICFCNKKEISTFNCPCKIVICKECYLKWRKQNNFCPSCRGPIM